jgi:predicted RNase H-like nuclease (RuvC/YqgF family)
LTNDDLLPAKLERTEEPAAMTSATKADAGKAQGSAATQGADVEANAEKLWRQKFAEAYKKLRLAEAELNVLDREWNKAQTEYYSDPQKAMKEQYTRKDINEHQQKIDAKKREVAGLRQAISSLEDELRRSGGDAGWAREP